MQPRFLRRLDLAAPLRRSAWAERRWGSSALLRLNDRFGRKRRRADRRAAMRAVVEAEGAGTGRAGHASRSPIRNCSARSSLICGAGSARWVERRAEAHEAPVVVRLRAGRVASPSKIACRVGRQFAGKDGRFGDAVEASARRSSRPSRGTPMMASSVSPPCPDLGLAGGADRGQRDHVDLGADPFGARDRLRGQQRARSPPAGRGSV